MVTSKMSNEFRNMPSVDRLISDERVRQLDASYSHDLLVELVRRRLQTIRQSIADGASCPPFDEIAEEIRSEVDSLTGPALCRVVNATGVLLHTNLGRSPLSDEAIKAMQQAAQNYNNLEFDLVTGKRGYRNTSLERILHELTGAESALVVNNNAAAVLLALTALAKKREVIVSRGQAVQIGGGFRIPDVLRQSGAKLVEVGTTNYTYVSDYEQAITPRTAALLRVHSSNFRIMGFTGTVSLEELVALGEKHDLPVFDDLGSGCLVDTTQYGLDAEPTAQQSIAAGVALAFFSGDKLLGGPQAGIIIGRKELVDKIKKHPLTRALRMDKVRLAGLAATLVHYLKGEATEKIPVWRMIALPLSEIERRAMLWVEAGGRQAQVADGESMVGGGSLPGGTLPTKLVAIGVKEKGRKGSVAQSLAEKLRQRPVPVIGRIEQDTLLLDPRSVFPEEDSIVIEALREMAGSKK
jgi:L-seryl-tRNA(Ser) seleniumtransferase